MVDPDPKPEEKKEAKEEVAKLSEAEKQRQFEIAKSALSRTS